MWLPYVAEDGTTGETGITTLLHFKSIDNEFNINLEAKHIIDTLCYHYPHLKDGDVLIGTTHQKTAMKYCLITLRSPFMMWTLTVKENC